MPVRIEATMTPGINDPLFAKVLSAIIRQFPFAMARALTDTVETVQTVQRQETERKYNIRVTGFFRRAVKINNSDRATPKKLEARIHINAKVTPKGKHRSATREDIFERMQEDTVRKPKAGNVKIAIPQKDVRRTTRSSIAKRDYPDEVKKRKNKQFRVDFVKGAAAGKSGVFERIGRRQKAFVQGVKGRQSLRSDPNVRFLYWLVKKADLDPQYDFFSNARVVIAAETQKNFDKRLEEAFQDIKIRL